MTVNAVALTPREHHGLGRLTGAASDILAVTERNLLGYRRVPQLLVFSTIQPVVFVLLFRYVFGGAIKVPGNSYVDFLMPGIFVQTVVFGAMGTAVGLATDLNTGLLERFRSLPMARSAVLAGRTTADLARNVFVVALMSAVGFAVGFRVHTSALDSWLRSRWCCSSVTSSAGFSPLSASSSAIPRPPRLPPFRSWLPSCSPHRHSSPSTRCPVGSGSSPSTSRSPLPPPRRARSSSGDRQLRMSFNRWPGARPSFSFSSRSRSGATSGRPSQR